MKRLVIIFILCACSSVCIAKPESAQHELKQKPSTLTIKVDTVCAPLDSTLTIRVDSATLSALGQNLLEKRRYGVELDSLDDRLGALSVKKNGLPQNLVFLIWFVILTIGLILIYIFHFVKRRDYIVNTVKSSGRVNSWILSKVRSVESSAYQNTNPSRSDNNALQKRIEELEEKIRILEERKESPLSQQKQTANPLATKKRELQPVSIVHKYYAESILDNRYVKVKESQTDDAIFEITIKPNKNTATVTVCKAAHRKVLANPSFLDGCDKQVFGNTSVNVEEEGTAERTDDNRWIVRKQIKVVLK